MTRITVPKMMDNKRKGLNELTDMIPQEPGDYIILAKTSIKTKEKSGQAGPWMDARSFATASLSGPQVRDPQSTNGHPECCWLPPLTRFRRQSIKADRPSTFHPGPQRGSTPLRRLRFRLKPVYGDSRGLFCQPSLPNTVWSWIV